MQSPEQLLRHSQVYAQEQPWRTRWHVLSTLLVLVALATAIVQMPWWPARLAASIVFGLTLVRAFIVYHDVQHGTILRGARRWRWFTNVFGVLMLSPPSIWRRSHDHHHRNVGRILGASIGSFPVMTCAAWARAGTGTRLAYVFQRHPLTIATGYLTVFLYGMCVRSLRVDPKRHADSGLALAVHAALVTLLAVFAPDLLLFLVLVPMTVACALGAYLFYAQHNYPGVQLSTGESWSFVGSALESSSYIMMGPLGHWFTGNIGYHHVHHVNPKIPFYRLPEAMAAIPGLQKPGTTSLWPRAIAQCLSLRLWDEERRCLVRAPGIWARA